MRSSSADTHQVSNGQLHLRRWDGSSAPAVAIHGVDGASSSWETIAELTGSDVSLVAPDLRGRGSSSSGEPFGVAAHATDLTELIEQLAAGPVLLVGHSFGAHVVTRVTADRPDLVRHLVLIDGGPARVIPDELSADGLAKLALGNIVPNLAAKPYPVSAEAVTTDFRSMVSDPASTEALAAVVRPITLFRAEHGMAEGMPPVIPGVVVDELRRAGLDLTDCPIAGATHFSLMSDHASEIGATLRALV